MSITGITNLLRGVKGHARTVFDRLFDIDEYTGELVLPGGMRDWAASKFGDLSGVEKQHIIKITNRVTLEGTLFNALRALRPLPGNDPAGLNRVIEEHKKGCAFCNPQEKTPADVFGRLAGTGAVTASNVAKYDCWHGLIIPVEHHPLRFDASRVADYFTLAAKWFRAVLEQPGEQAPARPRYPFLMWNCLWPAGSSVVHGHLQVTVTPGRHYPKVERLRRDALAYRRQYGENYFEDLYLAHRVVGLGVKAGDARAVVSLTPVKEKETCVLLPGKPGLERLGELGHLVGRVLVALRETGTSSFNVAVYIPPPGEEVPGEWDGFPLMARIVDRGNVSGRTADMGGMELYAASVVSTDPYQVLPVVEKWFCCY